MANPVWPIELPQTLQVQGHSYRLPEARVVTPMDAGPVKMRRRYTAAPEPFRGLLTLTREQLEILRGFYVSTLQHGTLRFDWKHPVTGAPAEVRFAPREDPPEAREVGAHVWEVALDLEVLA